MDIPFGDFIANGFLKPRILHDIMYAKRIIAREDSIMKKRGLLIALAMVLALAVLFFPSDCGWTAAEASNTDP
ncbi:hypothetical protein D7X94_10585 [Acutalibacter sp. 1XD8-33]|nr:hypothetical protein D7X94_10585 [Acutalibacter sp. 1XD8-33]